MKVNPVKIVFLLLLLFGILLYFGFGWIVKLILALIAVAVLIGIVYIYGFSVFPAFFTMFKDAYNETLGRKKAPVFNKYGVYLFCGRVGCGKTISMIHEAERLKKRFPKLKIYANFSTPLADHMIKGWEDILYSENIDENGVNQGILFLFDEIHLTFDSQSWAKAPANLLEYVSLQRHFHKCIFGSSQVWSRVNKILREQTDFVVECSCHCGKRLVKNVLFTQEVYQINGDLKDEGLRKRQNHHKYCFYASDRLRGLYNTDEVVGSIDLSKVGVSKSAKVAEKIVMELDLNEKIS